MMGFVNFLKKKKKKGLDLPPPPPGAGSLDLPEFEEVSDEDILKTFEDEPEPAAKHKGKITVEEQIEHPMKELSKRGFGIGIGSAPVGGEEMPLPPPKREMYPETAPFEEEIPSIEEEGPVEDILPNEEEPIEEMEEISQEEGPLLAPSGGPLPKERLFEENQKYFKEEPMWEEPEPAPRAVVAPKRIIKPKYIRVEDYKEILKGVNAINKKLNETENLIKEIDKLEKSKDKDFEMWRAKLDEMQRRLVFVDKTLFEIS